MEDLRLGHLRREFPVIAGELTLHDDQGAAFVQRPRARRQRSLADGALPAAEVVAAAADAGVELLALSDHDTIAGVPEAAAEADRRGLRLVPATEISALDSAGADLHILGYLVDTADPEFAQRLAEY